MPVRSASLQRRGATAADATVDFMNEMRSALQKGMNLCDAMNGKRLMGSSVRYIAVEFVEEFFFIRSVVPMSHCWTKASPFFFFLPFFLSFGELTFSYLIGMMIYLVEICRSI